MKKILLVLSIILLSGCGLNYKFDGEVYTIEDEKYIETKEDSNLIKIDIKDKGIMIAELFPEIAPITVENFKTLVNEGFYDGLTFHRVIKDFMIQTGDPTATGSGGSEKTIKGEFSLNGVENNLSHTRGVLSMARRGANPDTEETMNSASSQFFIVHKDSTYLDGNYAAFGKVIKGLEIIDKIAIVSTDSSDKPINNQIINSIKFVKIYEETEYDN